MRTAFSVAVLMGLTYAQRGYSSGRFNPYNVKPTPDPTPDPDNGGDDNRPEECKDKIDKIESDLGEVEGICDDQRGTLAGL